MAKLIAIDGPSGIGKSTIIPIVRKLLDRAGVPTEIAAVHRAGLFADMIQRLAQSTDFARTLALTVAAARAHLLEGTSTLLLWDRFVLSSLVYQVYAGVPRSFVYAINQPSLEDAIQVFLYVDGGILASRRSQRSVSARDWFKDHMQLETELTLYEEAIRLLAERGHIVHRVSAEGSPEATASALADLVLPYVARH